MPATSKSQQRLFGMIHAYQTGKIPAHKVSDRIKKIAKSISPTDAKHYATTSHRGLKEILHSILTSPIYTEQILREIVATKRSAELRGHLVDVYTARMLTIVMDKLNEENKAKLLSQPLNEMVALAYKVLTY